MPLKKSTAKRWVLLLVAALSLLAAGYYVVTYWNINLRRQVGDVVDELNGVQVYFNGGVNHVSGRRLTADGYNLGLSYQCVEFVKRYYYERFGHKMPDAYGHAKSFGVVLEKEFIYHTTASRF